MNLAKYLAQKLSDDGFDGLVNESIECGCGIDELSPCGELPNECVPAYAKRCGAWCTEFCEIPQPGGVCQWEPTKPSQADHMPLERIKEEA